MFLFWHNDLVRNVANWNVGWGIASFLIYLDEILVHLKAISYQGRLIFYSNGFLCLLGIDRVGVQNYAGWVHMSASLSFNYAKIN